MFKQRVTTALILAPLALLAIFFAPLEWFSALLSGVLLIGAWEWSNFIARRLSFRVMFVALVAALNLLLYNGPETLGFYLLVGSAIFWALALKCIFKYPKGLLFQSTAAKVIAGLLVLLPAWVALVGLRASDHGVLLIALLFSLVWGADIGAYFAGRRFGQAKLMPNVSPGKTLEGLYGGLAVCVLVAISFSILETLETRETLWLIVLSVLTGVVSVVGDLFESVMKRERGIKDSGTILPGHGGVLDRIDSLTAAAPVFFLGVTLAQIF